MYTIYKITRDNIPRSEEVLKDNIISRQSIAVRDASAIGMDGDWRYILIEGNEEALKRADELFTEIGIKENDTKAKEIYEKIRKEEHTVAEGVGFIFGE